MAISLNNHETRIKALENKSHLVNMWSGNIDASYKNRQWIEVCNHTFDPEILILKYTFDGGKSFLTSFVWNHPWIFYEGSEIDVRINGDLPPDGVRFEGLSVKVSNGKVYIRFSSSSQDTAGGNRLIDVVGLKLYYSFSYNIIYKILRSKISRLCQKFTLLKQKECEIIWL